MSTHHIRIADEAKQKFDGSVYVMRVIDDAERVVSKHKKLVTAQKACDKFHCQASNH